MYHPFGDSVPTPEYEGYADPAAAHGWENAYDDTVQFDHVVTDGPGGAGPSRLDRSAHRRAEARNRTLRRGALAGGGFAAVVLAVVVADFSFSGTSTQEEGPAITPTGQYSVSATGGPAGAGDGEGGEGRSQEGSKASDPASVEGSAGVSGRGSAAPSPGRSTAPVAVPPAASAAPATTAPALPGNSDDRPGKGKGSTKGPK
ncbi:hypothetical protein [Streptomyces sp. NPDC002845]